MDTSIKIPCTLIPTGRYQLLLPNSAIVEVLTCSELTPPKQAHTSTNAGIPTWLLGTLSLQDQPISVINFDAIEANAVSNDQKKNTIVIIRNTVTNASSSKHYQPYLGIYADRIPHILEVRSQNIERELHPQHTHSQAIGYIDIQGMTAIIPNIPSLLNMIEDISLA